MTQFFYCNINDTNILNLKTQILILLLFLLTGSINKSIADTIHNKLDSTEFENSILEDEIKQSAEDSLKLSIDKKKVFLYGNAKIEYKETTISASYIEIDWNKNTIYASHTTSTYTNH